MTAALAAVCCELVTHLRPGGLLSKQAMPQMLAPAAYSKHVALQAMISSAGLTAINVNGVPDWQEACLHEGQALRVVADGPLVQRFVLRGKHLSWEPCRHRGAHGRVKHG